MLELKDRFLSRSGKTVYEPEQAAPKIATEGGLFDYERVFQCSDSKKFEYVYGETVIFNDIEDEPQLCDTTHNSTQFERLIEHIESSERYTEDEKYLSRVEKELKFFEHSNNITFLLKLKEMIDQFKEDGVVWGVGRGSSCASLILYLLEVHDIDPVYFDIPFIELTKTDPDDYG